MRRWLIFLIALCTGCTLVELAPTPTPTLAPGDPVLTVAWVEAGDLFVWSADLPEARRIATSGVIRPYLSPDGRYVAFTRGPLGVAETLWVVQTAGGAE